MSASTVSVYGLDDRANEVRSPAETKPASCTMVLEVLSQGLKRGRGVTLTTQPHLVPKLYLLSTKAPKLRVVDSFYLFRSAV
jgi:hypothetical protein